MACNSWQGPGPAVFGAMSLYGYATGQDLTRLGSFLIMALMGERRH